MDSPIIPFNKNTDLQTGDILIVSGIIPFINHYAIVYKKNGVKYVAEIDLESIGVIANTWKVISEPLEDYSKRRTITGYVRNEKTQSLTDQYIQAKIKDCAPIGEKFLGYNCEDFIIGIYGTDLGYDKSAKLGYILLIVIVVLSILYFAFNKKTIS